MKSASLTFLSVSLKIFSEYIVKVVESRKLETVGRFTDWEMVDHIEKNHCPSKIISQSSAGARTYVYYSTSVFCTHMGMNINIMKI